MGKRVRLQFWNARNLGKQGSLESVLDTVLGMGFRIDFIRVYNLESPLEPFARWPHYSKQIIEEIGIAYEKKNLAFLISNDQSDEYSYLTLWFKLSWKENSHGVKTHQNLHVYTSQSSQLFTQKKLHREFYSQLLLDISIQLYNILRPEFGWIERCRLRGYTKLKDIESFTIPHVYWANFFGPNYVQNVGKEFLANAPGWKFEGLNDGGMLYVLSSHMASFRKNNQLQENIKAYFKIDSVR